METMQRARITRSGPARGPLASDSRQLPGQVEPPPQGACPFSNLPP